MIYFHTEQDFFPAIRNLVISKGVVYYDEIYDYAEKNFALTDADYEVLPSSASMRYKQILRNLRSNKTMELDGDIVPVDKGFATSLYAKTHGLGVFSTGSVAKSGPQRSRGVVCKTARDAWANGLFRTDEMTTLRNSTRKNEAKADLDVLLPIDFAKKYNITF